MLNDFYRCFEDRFRGSREVIKSRLRIYLPFLLQLRHDDACFPILDLGCGRGEWLELLTENGFSPVGVDMDEAMLSACRERGLQVHCGDAIAFIKDLPGQTQKVVSGFHIAEHLDFHSLQGLVSEALRILEPGGLLILETPNPENLVVGTSSFYLDPTHNRPIPPQLLAYLPEFLGFSRVKILRLQEAKELQDCPTPSLYDVLTGVSPDYAVIAQKAGPLESMAFLDDLFEESYGLTLGALTGRYQGNCDSRFRELEASSVRVEATASKACASANEAAARAGEALALAGEAADSAARVEVIATNQAKQLEAVYASTSWKITRPIRLAGRVLKRIIRYLRKVPDRLLAARQLIKRASLAAVRVGVTYLHGKPRLKRFVMQLLNRTPGLAVRLRRLHLSSSATVQWVHERDAGMVPAEAGYKPQVLKPRLDGVNASQRSPLERYFHAYSEE